MGYDERQQSNSSGSLVAVIALGLVLAILAILAVAGVGLFWVRAARMEAIVVATEQQRAIAELHAVAVAQRTVVEEPEAMALSPVEESGIAWLHFQLTLDREGNASVDGEKTDLAELRATLVKLKDETSNAFSVQVHADPECPIKHVIPVLDVCDEVGDIDVRVTSSEDSVVPADESNAQR